jgi:hypothetical protein
MLAIIISLSVLCILLSLVIYCQDEKNVSLAAENGLMKGRMASINEGTSIQDQSAVLNQPLTAEDVEAAVRYAGFIPDTTDNLISFKVEGKTFDIDISRLPAIGIVCDYLVDKDEWDVDLMGEAAHLMMDSLIMVKAHVIEGREVTILRSVIIAMDRNYISFRDNLMQYVNILRRGKTILTEKYDNLVEEKNHPSQAATPLLTFQYGA